MTDKCCHTGEEEPAGTAAVVQQTDSSELKVKIIDEGKKKKRRKLVNRNMKLELLLRSWKKLLKNHLKLECTLSYLPSWKKKMFKQVELKVSLYIL